MTVRSKPGIIALRGAKVVNGLLPLWIKIGMGDTAKANKSRHGASGFLLKKAIIIMIVMGYDIIIKNHTVKISILILISHVNILTSIMGINSNKFRNMFFKDIFFI